MNSRAGEAQPAQLLQQTIRHCRNLSVAKKERVELEELCTTLNDRLSDHSLAPKQANYDNLKSELVEVEGQLAVWSNYNLVKRLMNRGAIKEGIRESIGHLRSIDTGSPAIPSTPGTPSSRGVEGILSNGVVTRQGEIPFAEGRSCEVWKGQWNNRGRGNGSGEEIGKEGGGTRIVALKALKPPQPQGKAGDFGRAEGTGRAEWAREKLENELLLWRDLNHPNILPFYGGVEIGARLYMVFPWRENGHLLDYVEKNPGSNKNYLLRGSAAGLSYLHQKKYVHGNVRCNNVFITRKGEPQICDFGTSKIFHGSHENTVSKTGSPATNVRYAAPELLEHNDFRATAYSDTYSFALLILECVTQAPPFSNLQREAEIIHERIVKKGHPPRPDGGHRIPNDLWEVMTRCWTVAPKQRPSMEDVHTFFLRY